MFRFATVLFCLSLMLVAAPKKATPYVGYLYPAGGQTGTTFQIMAGGRNLRTVTKAYISGEGVTATVREFLKPEFRRDKELVQKFRKDLKGEMKERRIGTDADPMDEDEMVSMEVTDMRMAGYPLNRDLGKLNADELQEVFRELGLARKKKQKNRQLAESVVLSITVAADAKPGIRELRLQTKAGLTNPVRLHIDTLPEAAEIEPNGPEVYPKHLLQLPVMVNGQIMPGDIDRLRFSAKAGQNLVLNLHARRLIPYLADAVPGWFQATLTVLDSKGCELAYVDDYRFKPDPIMEFEVPADGDYLVVIRDAIYRGREDFVYRLSIAERPLPEDVFPLVAAQDDNNSLAELMERESNNCREQAQAIALPTIINGRISKSGELDWFRISSRAGTEIVAEIEARQLDSPLDSLLRITDGDGSVLAWNDDFKRRNVGLVTHNADSYARLQIPEDGDYFVSVADATNHGSSAHTYRLRLSEPKPDFQVYLHPSGILMNPGHSQPVTATVIRKDGFEGPITLALKNAPAGMRLDGAMIPAGVDRVAMTLTAPPKPHPKPLALQVEASAQMGNGTHTRPALASDDVMQAFLWRHIVPAESLTVVVPRSRQPVPNFRILNETPLQLSSGKEMIVEVTFPHAKKLSGIHLDLIDAPKGFSLGPHQIEAGKTMFMVKVSENVKPCQLNLIVAISAEQKPGNPGKKAKGKKKVVLRPVGFLPAIPVVVTAK